ETCDEVVVMYAGRVVEQAPVLNIFKSPQHAYTKGLLASMTKLDTPRKSVLKTIPNMVAGIADFVPGCRFCQRMEREGESLEVRPEFIEVAEAHWVEACPQCTDHAPKI
ncbi:MAG: peptide/nickel transport system ATP-binding protein, partial [Cryomorphaceae bacterium]